MTKNALYWHFMINKLFFVVCDILSLITKQICTCISQLRQVRWCESCSVVSESLWPHGLYSAWNSPGQNTEVGSLSPKIDWKLFLQLFLSVLGEIGSKGSSVVCVFLCDPMDCSSVGSSGHRILQAKILEWLAFPFSRGSSQPRDQTQVSHIAGGFFTSWTTREVQFYQLG